MPVQSCQEDGRPGYQWGTEGKCFTYRPGDEAGRKAAREKAMKQGQAIAFSRARERGRRTPSDEDFD